MPMVSIQDEARDRIEDKISKLNTRLADSINQRIFKIREEKAESTMKKINEMTISETSEDVESLKDDFE